MEIRLRAGNSIEITILSGDCRQNVRPELPALG